MRSGRGDRIFAGGVTGLALIVPLTLAGLTALMVEAAWPSITRYGVGFLLSSTWDPVKEIFGAAAYLYGTLVTTAIAVVLAAPVAVGAAIFLVEYAPKRIAGSLSFLIEVLAYIPSIVYGLWGLFVLVPLFRENVEPSLQSLLGPVPILGGLFSGAIGGRDLLVGGVILAIMIVPILVAVSREVIAAVPIAQREGMLGIGATKWEMVRGAVLPYARTGIIGAIVLGLARAFGETMAVTLVVGNSSTAITSSLFVPGYTMASAIANQFVEATGQLYFSAIVEIAVLLLVVALIVNTLARLLIRRVSAAPQGFAI